MKKRYIAPTLDCLRFAIPGVICASPTTSLNERAAVRGEEADSKGFCGGIIWDSEDNSNEIE